MNKRMGASALAFCACLVFASGCGSSSSSSTEDSSTSGAVAAAIGGGNSGSTSGGTMSSNFQLNRMDALFAWMDGATDALASTACPVYSSSLLGAGEQTYSNCSFSGSSAVWNGGVTFTGTAGTTVTRLIANSTTRTAASGTVVTINTSGSGLTPFYSGDTAPSGGSTWTPSSLAINGVNFVAANSGGTTLFNHVLTTNSTDGGTTLTISSNTITAGKVITYHQLAHVKATSTFSNVTLSSSCCLPTGGSITTTFNTSDSRALAKYNGTTETLTFTGCGTATYSGPESYSGNVTLAHCL